MPIYEYECSSCGKLFERITFSKEDGKIACPACGSPETEKVMSGFCSVNPSKSTQRSACGPTKKFS